MPADPVVSPSAVRLAVEFPCAAEHVQTLLRACGFDEVIVRELLEFEGRHAVQVPWDMARFYSENHKCNRPLDVSSVRAAFARARAEKRSSNAR